MRYLVSVKLDDKMKDINLKRNKNPFEINKKLLKSEQNIIFLILLLF